MYFIICKTHIFVFLINNCILNFFSLYLKCNTEQYLYLFYAQFLLCLDKCKDHCPYLKALENAFAIIYKQHINTTA